MAHRRNRKPDPLELIGPIVGLAIMLSVLSPKVRAVIMLLPIMSFVGGGVFLLVAAILFIMRRQMARADVPPPVQPRTQSIGDLTQSLEQSISARTKLSPPKQSTQGAPARFTSDLLAELEWRRFEILVTLYFQKTGHEARRSRAGADGGVDIFISQPRQTQPQACVQCKAWNTYDVGVKPVRELFGVMAADSIPSGYFVTSGSFSSEAMAFARDKPLVLIDGKQLLENLNSMPEPDRAAILQEVTSGDYTTPTCPRCDVKMVQRDGSKGAFWGCRSFPQCRQTFKMSDQEAD